MDLSADAKLNETHVHGVSPKIISIIECASGYCLLGYWLSIPVAKGGLIKYDGRSFEELSRQGEVKDMAWNGEEWLILYSKGEYRSSVVETYNGFRMKKIIPPPIRFGKKEEYWVTNYTWDAIRGSWLIRAKVGIPLSGKPMKEAVVEYPGKDAMRGICGPGAVLLIALLPVFVYRRN
jgi:hypothetical protein